MSKSTSLAQLQNNGGGMNEHIDGGGNMTDVDEVMNQLGNQEEYFEQQAPQNPQQAQMMAAQQQQAQMMAAQQQQAQMMAAQQQQAQMMAAQEQQAHMMANQQQFSQKNGNALLPTNTKQLTFVEKVMGELKDSLVVLVVFVLLNFKPVGKLTYDLLGKFTQNEHIVLVTRGLFAGVLFYVVKRLILNQ
jgi:ATPase subunit of ABC transporter with duplicated ATPase domains